MEQLYDEGGKGSYWNINPYAFPMMPNDEYPIFYVDPNMAQTGFGISELERLSIQMTGGHGDVHGDPFTSVPTTFA